MAFASKAHAKQHPTTQDCNFCVILWLKGSSPNPPNPTWGWRRRRRRHPTLGCARLSQGSYQGILIPGIDATSCAVERDLEVLITWSQLATIFQGHCTRADLQQSLSTPLLLFSKLWEATPRPELPQPSSSSDCRRGQSDFQLRPEISSEHLRASNPMFKIWKNGWNAHAHCRTASKHQGFGHPDAPLHPRRPQRLTNGWTLILTFIHSHTQKYGICRYQEYGIDTKCLLLHAFNKL